MEFGIKAGAWNQVFAVPCNVVDEHLKLAPDSALRALLFLLRQSGTMFSCAALAKELGLTEEECADALLYWKDAGILEKAPDKGTVSPSDRQAEPVPEEPAVQQVEKPAQKEFPLSDRVTLLSATAPHPDRREVARRLEESKSLSFLIPEAEKLLDRPLSASQVSTLVYLHDYVGLSCAVILMAVEYCRSVGKPTVRAAEKLLLSWADTGVTSVDKAERYISEHMALHEAQGRISRLFGIAGRALTPKEKDYIRIWVMDYAFSDELIKLAYNRAIDSKGTLRFSYINGILADWFRKGVRAPSDLERLDKKPATAGKADAVHYRTESSIDMNKVRELELMDIPEYGKGAAK